MRDKFRKQTLLGMKKINELEIPIDSRHRIYPTLIALQEIYKKRSDIVDLVYTDLLSDYHHTTNDLIEPILSELMDGFEVSLPNTDEYAGAPGMTAWQTLVAVTLRQSLNLSYDDLEILFDQNKLVREFLEISSYEKDRFSESRLGRNCRKISPETIKAINDAVLKLAVENDFEDGKTLRGDSFVCKTNIHYPSDTKAINESCNRVISLCVKATSGKNGWRQHEHWRKAIKSLAMKLVQCKRSKKKDKELKAKEIKEAYGKLIGKARELQTKAFKTWEELLILEHHQDLGYYMCCLEIMIDLAEKRVMLNEKLSPSEKIYSIFEPHTELVHRGKYPLPIEYGHRILVVEGKSGMILDHKIMENGVLDQDEVLPMLERLNQKYGKVKILSLDKGYNSKKLKELDLESKVDFLVLPSKGYKNKDVKKKESEKGFIKSRLWRAGVEACIGTLMSAHGADKCRDKKIRGYRRWVSACVLSRNLVTFGKLLLEQRKKEAA